MGYYVVHPGGQRYGPADLATLNAWAAEGRLVPSTPLIDAATGTQLLAQDLPGIYFSGGSQTTIMPGPSVGTPLGGYSAPGSQQPNYTPYGGGPYPRAATPLGTGGAGGPRPTAYVTVSYGLSLASVCGICCCPLVGIILGLAALGVAAADKSHSPKVKWAYAAAAGAILLNVGLYVAGEFLGHMLRGG